MWISCGFVCADPGLEPDPTTLVSCRAQGPCRVHLPRMQPKLDRVGKQCVGRGNWLDPLFSVRFVGISLGFSKHYSGFYISILRGPRLSTYFGDANAAADEHTLNAAISFSGTNKSFLESNLLYKHH